MLLTLPARVAANVSRDVALVHPEPQMRRDLPLWKLLREQQSLRMSDRAIVELRAGVMLHLPLLPRATLRIRLAKLTAVPDRLGAIDLSRVVTHVSASLVLRKITTTWVGLSSSRGDKAVDVVLAPWLSLIHI